MRTAWRTLALAMTAGSAGAQVHAPLAAAQNPSPMTESTRAHERLVEKDFDGVKRTFNGPGEKPVEVFVPRRVNGDKPVDVVIHFLGAGWIPAQAVAALGSPTVAAVVNLGAGSGVYHRAFTDPAAFDSLLGGIGREVSGATGRTMRTGRIALVGFSAGHGAIRVK